MELTGREGEVVLLEMARARMISSQSVQKLSSSLLYSVPLHSSSPASERPSVAGRTPKRKVVFQPISQKER